MCLQNLIACQVIVFLEKEIWNCETIDVVEDLLKWFLVLALFESCFNVALECQ
jgi:hypothetical protein